MTLTATLRLLPLLRPGRSVAITDVIRIVGTCIPDADDAAATAALIAKANAAASNSKPAAGKSQSVTTIVLRAGDYRSIVRYVLTPDNTATWEALRSQRMKIGLRICYCSVFNECWLTELRELGDQQNLNPPAVKMCARPEVVYTE